MSNINKQIDTAVKILSKGGIIIFPTDTAFGIGCRIDKPTAIKKLFQIRKRPEDKAVPVLVDSIEMAEKYATFIPNTVKNELISKYWPGALTVIFKCKDPKIPDLVKGGTDTIGLRMPDHKIILEIIKRSKVPILGPSANFHGSTTPYKFNDLNKDLVSRVDYVLNGECKYNTASTVIDCTSNNWHILRKGAVNLDHLGLD